MCLVVVLVALVVALAALIFLIHRVVLNTVVSSTALRLCRWAEVKKI